METQLQITARDVTLTPADERAIRREAAKLDRFHRRIMSCRVLIGAEHRYPTGGEIEYTVRIDLTVPGGELPVTRRTDPQLRTAIHAAFDAVQRQLEDFARRRRGDVKTPEGPPRARISRLFPADGYGFLTTADGRDIYFHENSVPNGKFARLAVGDEVRFEETRGDEGPQASTVNPVGRGRKHRRRATA